MTLAPGRYIKDPWGSPGSTMRISKLLAEEAGIRFYRREPLTIVAVDEHDRAITEAFTINCCRDVLIRRGLIPFRLRRPWERPL